MRGWRTGWRHPQRHSWPPRAATLVLISCAVAACQAAPQPVQPVPRDFNSMAAHDKGVTANALAGGRWSRLEAAPIPDRDHPVGAWTGKELLVWGGQSGQHGTVLHGDGAAYDPSRRAWRQLPPAPLTPRTGAAATWTGRELIVWGGYDRSDGKSESLHAAADGAAYDPARGTWRRLPPAPLSALADATAMWTGREVLVVGSNPAVKPDRGQGHTDGAAYDPARDTWRRLAPAPRPHGNVLHAQHAVWAGTRLLVWSDWEQYEELPSEAGTRSFSHMPGVDAWAYDPATDRWEVLPPAPGQPAMAGAVLLWTGQEILSFGGRPYHGPPVLHAPAARYDPEGNRWRHLADGPLDTAAVPTALWTGASLLVWNSMSQRRGTDTAYEPGDAAAWDPHDNQWARLPRSPLAGTHAVTAWTGKFLLVWGGTPWPAKNTHTGMIFTPAAP
jgi:N-acetylneuraminic acid mutarotase